MFLRRVFPVASAVGLVLAASLVFSGVLLGASAAETDLSIAKVRTGARTVFTFRDGGSACVKGGRTGRLDVNIGTMANYFAVATARRARPGRYGVSSTVYGAPTWQRRVGEHGPRHRWWLIRGTMTIAPGLKQGTFSGRAQGPTRRVPASGSWSCARIVLIPD